MKSNKCMVAAVVLIISFPVLAPKADATAQQGESAAAVGSPVNHSSDANANGNASAAGSASGTPELQPVRGELVNKLDSRSAVVGDTVVVKTTLRARSTDGTFIPKGSRIVGHVTEVRAHSKANEESVLAVQFDRVELKGGQTVPIHSVIEWISPSSSASALSPSSLESDETLGVSNSGGGARSSGLIGGALSEGGALAGSPGRAFVSTPRTLGTAASAADSGVASAREGVLFATSRATGDVTATSRDGLQTGTRGSGALAALATDIPGLMLVDDAAGATSGTLSALRKNVRLDTGTQLILGVSSAISR